MKHLKQFIQLLLLLCLLLNPFDYDQLYAQEDLSKATMALAKYTSGNGDRTIRVLQSLGYNPPDYLKREWKKYPAVRKITMAYEAAKQVSPENGEKFLANLSKELAQKYEAVWHEPDLKALKNKTGPVSFQHPAKWAGEQLPKPLKKQLLTLSKYTELGALGGNRGVLVNDFGLANTEAFDILCSSKNGAEALEKGLAKASIPPSKNTRLSRINTKLTSKYEGARLDPNLEKRNRNTNFKGKKITYSINNTPPKAITASTYKINNLKNTNRYNAFFKRSYPKVNNRIFRDMIHKIGGLGGVIFGNKITDNTNLPSLDFFHFIPQDSSIENSTLGTLEFIFEDGTQILETSVDLEHVIAAAELVFHDDSIGQNEGYGLAGIQSSYSSFYQKNIIETTVHPSLVPLRLGRDALICDVLPSIIGITAENLFEEQSRIDIQPIMDWSSNAPWMTYKIIDVPLTLRRSNNTLVLNRTTDSLHVDGAYISLHGFSRTSSSSGEEDLLFYNNVPLLTHTVWEFNRLNEFAKILALFRWAKSKGGRFFDCPKTQNALSAPDIMYLGEEYTNVSFRSIAEEHQYFKGLKDSLALKNANLSSNANFLKQAHNKLKDTLAQWNNKLNALWEMPIDATAAPTNCVTFDVYDLFPFSNFINKKMLEFHSLKEKIKDYESYKNYYLKNGPSSWEEEIHTQWSDFVATFEENENLTDILTKKHDFLLEKYPTYYNLIANLKESEESADAFRKEYSFGAEEFHQLTQFQDYLNEWRTLYSGEIEMLDLIRGRYCMDTLE